MAQSRPRPPPGPLHPAGRAGGDPRPPVTHMLRRRWRARVQVYRDWFVTRSDGYRRQARRVDRDPQARAVGLGPGSEGTDSDADAQGPVQVTSWPVQRLRVRLVLTGESRSRPFVSNLNSRATRTRFTVAASRSHRAVR